MSKYIKVKVGYNEVLIPVTEKSLLLIGELLNAIPGDSKYEGGKTIFYKENKTMEIEVLETEIKDVPVDIPVVPVTLVATPKLDEDIPF